MSVPLSEIRRKLHLLHLLPRAPEASIPRGLTEADLDAFALRTGLSVPSEMREWLKVSNGPCVGPGGMLGIRTARSELDIESLHDLYPTWRERGWIPLAGDGCGNYYVVVSRHERAPVAFVDVALDPDAITYVASSSVLRFLDALFDKELGRETRWPFDEAWTLSADPALRALLDAFPAPWDPDGSANRG